MAKPYNPDKLLIHLHVPKTGGSSLREVLRLWFVDDKYINFKKKFVYSKNSVVSWHFDTKEFGDDFGLPNEDQYITFLREPFDRLISLYTYWNTINFKKEIRIMPKKPLVKIGDVASNFEEFVFKNPLEFDDFLPKGDKSKFDNFIFVGILEKMQTCTNALAKIINKPIVEVPVVNNSSWNIDEYNYLREDYKKLKPHYYEDYYYVIDTWSKIWGI